MQNASLIKIKTAILLDSYTKWTNEPTIPFGHIFKLLTAQMSPQETLQLFDVFRLDLHSFFREAVRRDNRYMIYHVMKAVNHIIRQLYNNHVGQEYIIELGNHFGKFNIHRHETDEVFRKLASTIVKIASNKLMLEESENDFHDFLTNYHALLFDDEAAELNPAIANETPKLFYLCLLLGKNFTGFMGLLLTSPDLQLVKKFFSTFNPIQIQIANKLKPLMEKVDLNALADLIQYISSQINVYQTFLERITNHIHYTFHSIPSLDFTDIAHKSCIKSEEIKYVFVEWLLNLQKFLQKNNSNHYDQELLQRSNNVCKKTHQYIDQTAVGFFDQVPINSQQEIFTLPVELSVHIASFFNYQMARSVEQVNRAVSAISKEAKQEMRNACVGLSQ